MVKDETSADLAVLAAQLATFATVTHGSAYATKLMNEAIYKELDTELYR